MAEVYSSLYKGMVHITTKFSATHHGLDLGNYKTKNKIYSPTKFGTGKVTKIATTDEVNGVVYKDVSTIWYEYPGGWEMVLVHGDPKDQVVKVGQTVKVGQQIYVTGNKGFSKGDHLHVQLKKNGVYQDPAKYVINDKPTPPVVVPPVVDWEKKSKEQAVEIEGLKTELGALRKELEVERGKVLAREDIILELEKTVSVKEKKILDLENEVKSLSGVTCDLGTFNSTQLVSELLRRFFKRSE